MLLSVPLPSGQNGGGQRLGKWYFSKLSGSRFTRPRRGRGGWRPKIEPKQIIENVWVPFPLRMGQVAVGLMYLNSVDKSYIYCLRWKYHALRCRRNCAHESSPCTILQILYFDPRFKAPQSLFHSNECAVVPSHSSTGLCSDQGIFMGFRTLDTWTKKLKMVFMRLKEICSCSCLTVLLGSAWVLLNKIYKPFSFLCIWPFDNAGTLHVLPPWVRRCNDSVTHILTEQIHNCWVVGQTDRNDEVAFC